MLTYFHDTRTSTHPFAANPYFRSWSAAIIVFVWPVNANGPGVRAFCTNAASTATAARCDAPWAGGAAATRAVSDSD